MERFSLALRRRAYARFFHGFTMIEFLISLTLLSLLLSLAVPSFNDFKDQSQLVTDLNKLQSLLSFARMESVKSGYKVVVCRWDGNSGCTGGSQKGTQQWAKGALLFIDRNEDRLLSAQDSLMKIVSFSSGSSITWNRGEVLVYESDGSVYGPSNGTFIISNGGSFRKLIISMTGRVRRVVN